MEITICRWRGSCNLQLGNRESVDAHGTGKQGNGVWGGHMQLLAMPHIAMKSAMLISFQGGFHYLVLCWFIFTTGSQSTDLRGWIKTDSLLECSDPTLLCIQPAYSAHCMLQILAGWSLCGLGQIFHLGSGHGLVYAPMHKVLYTVFWY